MQFVAYFYGSFNAWPLSIESSTAGPSSGIGSLRANPAKVEDFCDKDLLQVIDLVRFLFGKLIPTCREAH